MSEVKKVKPHTFGSARLMTQQEKEAVDAAFMKGINRVEPLREIKLKQENAELRARVARLEEPYSRYGEDGETDVGVLLFYEQVVSESPKRSLAEIEAAAIAKMADHFERNMKASGWMSNISLEEIDEYTNQLRKESE